MKTMPKNTSPQGRQGVVRNVILYAGTLVVASLCAFWWLAQERNNQISNLPVAVTVPLAESPPALDAPDDLPLSETSGAVPTSPLATLDSQSVQLEGRQSQVTAEQSQLFETLWARLHDPDSRDSLTAQQIIGTPGFKSLPVELMQRLVDEAMAMLEQGELDETLFMSQHSGRQGGIPQLPHAGKSADGQNGELYGKVQNTAVMVTPEQRESLEEIKRRLGDPAFTQSLTASKMLAMQDVQSLPESLRHELTTEVMQMLERGDLDRDQFLIAPAEPSSQVDGSQTAPSRRTGTEAERAATTYEQWQAYEDLQARLHNPDFLANVSLEQLLSDSELKNLPAYLRAQLQTEVVESIQRGEWVQR